jgi:hydrogenase-4 component E
MKIWIDAALVFIVLVMALLGTSRLGACVRFVAVQGMALSALTLLLHHDELTLRIVLLAVGGIIVKGVAFPLLLSRALREANVRREVEPYVGYSVSLFVGVLAIGVSLWLGSRLPIPGGADSPLLVPLAFFTILTGLFLIVSRKKAITQVLGYLVLENGIYAFGVAFVPDEPMLVELGVLLDVLVGVFVMGIAIFHISREFEHMDVDQLATLRDWSGKGEDPR